MPPLPFLTPGTRADGRIRTADQLITNQLLYQLSYIGSRILRFIKLILNGLRTKITYLFTKRTAKLGRFSVISKDYFILINKNEATGNFSSSY
jgi:hypothetical protein